jgi:pimeloyl-ACP methyl ester carboxylesterase
LINDIFEDMTRLIKKLILLTFLLSLTTSYLFAQQQFVGSWYGTLKIQGIDLPLVFNISGNATAGFKTTMDSPAQKAKGIPVEKTTVQGAALLIESAMMKLSYSGNYIAGSNKIKGVFKQNGLELDLTLDKNKPAEAVAKNRPQEPKTFPYKQEDVVFNNPKGRNKLAGTLTMPRNGKPSKVIVLISGSGAQDRNSLLLGTDHRPFLVWSDWLTRQGIAVLRYDDRGVGKSTGNFNLATTADFADDAEAAVKYISSRADLKGVAIGLLGHSEGGMIAPMVATRNPSVAFMVLLAAPGLKVTEVMERQVRDQFKLSGMNDSAMAASLAISKSLYAATLRYKALPMEAFKKKFAADYGKTVRANMKHLPGSNADNMINQAVATVATPWFRYFVIANPADYLSKVKCPVLAINGTLDMQVNSEANLKGIKANLEKAGNKKFEIVPMAGLNHLLQKAETGALPEYTTISETVNPAVLKKVSDWVIRR